MFCPKCAAENPAQADHCHQCNTPLSVPGLSTAQPQPSSPHAATAPALWNPSAAANWSLLFTPAFGSYLHMLNWKALGQTDKAKSAQNWFYISIAMLILYALIWAFSSPESLKNDPVPGLVFLYLIVWYFAAGRSQGQYVKQKFGTTYPRKPWGKALLVGVAGTIGFNVCAFIIGIIRASVGYV